MKSKVSLPRPELPQTPILAAAEQPGFTAPYLVFQHRGQDVLAVPEIPKAAALAGIARYQPFTFKRRFFRILISGLIRIGAARFAAVRRVNPLGHEIHIDFASLCAEIESRLGRRITHVIVIWPAQRSRRRLYLHLLDADLQSFAFVKLAFTTDDHAKLATEAHALDSLTRRPSNKIRAPKALYHGQFRGVSFLIIEALPADAKPLKLDANCNSSQFSDEYRGSLKWFSGLEITKLSWWTAYARNVPAGHQTFHAELLRLLPLGTDLGRAHGDLGLANMVDDGKRVWIFDWENCHAAAPALADSIGFFMSFNLAKSLRSPNASLRRLLESFSDDGSDRRRLAIMLSLAFRHACGLPDAAGMIQVWPQRSPF